MAILVDEPGLHCDIIVVDLKQPQHTHPYVHAGAAVDGLGLDGLVGTYAEIALFDGPSLAASQEQLEEERSSNVGDNLNQDDDENEINHDDDVDETNEDGDSVTVRSLTLWI